MPFCGHVQPSVASCLSGLCPLSFDHLRKKYTERTILCCVQHSKIPFVGIVSFVLDGTEETALSPWIPFLGHFFDKAWRY